MRKLILMLCLLTVLVTLFTSGIVKAQESIVLGVFFYSPTCPHCQDVINNHWPGIQEQFGDQLRVLFINASSPEGGALMGEALTALQIESSGVPMLIIGSEVMVGAVDIPMRAPGIIQTGLAAGGIGLPAIPGIEEIYQVALAQSQQTSSTEQPAAQHEVADVPPAAPNLLERLAADPLANGLAVLILLLLVVSLIGVLLTTRWPLPTKSLSQAVLTITPLLGLVISASLIAGGANEPLVLLLAVGEFMVFLALLVAAVKPAWLPQVASWRVPLTTVAGLGAAAYLAFIEINQLEAVCGLVGNCNIVQQSPYAQIAGIPIGVIGIAGYIALLGLWVVARPMGSPVVLWMLRAATLFGVGFSTYLTFLEPFVIGATCLWCLTSALIMLILLWLVFTPDSNTLKNTGARVAA
jgi:uncharacterized membrane protein